jgi:hypothetical protein
MKPLGIPTPALAAASKSLRHTVTQHARDDRCARLADAAFPAP